MAKSRMASSISIAHEVWCDRLKRVPFQKPGHAVDAAARLDACADVDDVATDPRGLVPLPHPFPAGRHQNFARRQSDEVHRQAGLRLHLVLNLDQAEVASA